MKYVEEIIGDDYKNWKIGRQLGEYGDCVFISAPTGAGKTFFILKKYMKYLYGKKNTNYYRIGRQTTPETVVLYLVNRKILKAQIEEELYGLDLDQEKRSCIHIQTYQALEDAMVNNRLPHWYSQVNVIICDEAHYFLQDSNFNTNTAYSFLYIQEQMYALKVFISATIDEFRDFALERLKARYEPNLITGPYRLLDLPWFFAINQDRIGAIMRNHTYSVERSYDYLEFEILPAKADLIFAVKESKEKWLIFVDSKNRGDSFFCELIKEDEDIKEDIVFIDADNRYKDADETKKQLIVKEYAEKRVLISTSVIDNGINIKDRNLRNIVIMADTETEFIQMLGRKRRDGEKVKLYLWNFDKSHFEDRIRELRNVQKFVEKYMDKIRNYQDYNSITQWIHEQEEDYYKKVCTSSSNYLIDKYRRNMELFGVELNVSQLLLSRLSFSHIDNLYRFYHNTIERFEQEGDDKTFYRMQLEWLGFSKEKIEEILRELMTDKIERAVKKVEEILEIIKEKEDSKEIKALEDDMKEYLIILVGALEIDEKNKDSIILSIKKNDRDITGKGAKELDKKFDLGLESYLKTKKISKKRDKSK